MEIFILLGGFCLVATLWMFSYSYFLDVSSGDKKEKRIKLRFDDFLAMYRVNPRRWDFENMEYIVTPEPPDCASLEAWVKLCRYRDIEINKVRFRFGLLDNIKFKRMVNNEVVRNQILESVQKDVLRSK